MALLLALAPARALAADVRQGNSVSVGPQETVNDDVYLFGGIVSVQGTVNGNVIIFGGTISVGGAVSRDVMVTGGTVTVTGRVGGSIRAAGGNLTISGPVEEDVVVAGGTVTMAPSAKVGRDLLVATGSATMAGSVARKVLAGAGELIISGPVGGDVRARVDRLRLEDGAQIDGNLDYTSDNEATIAQGARVRGIVQRHPRQGSAAGRAASGIIGWLRTLVGLSALGLLFVLLLPGFSQSAMVTVRRSPWASLGLGLALLVVTPILATIVFILGLFVGGWWLGLLVLVFYALAVVLGYVLAGLFAGRWTLDRLGQAGANQAWALVLGLVLLTLVSLIPLLGGLVILISVMAGLGGLALALARLQAPPPPTPALPKP